MLVDCVVYNEGKKIRVADPKEFTLEKDEFMWAAFVSPQPGEVEELALKLGVHELALEDIRHGNQIPKLEEYDEHVFLVLKQLSWDSDGYLKDNDVYLLAGPNYVITIRDEDTFGFSNLRRRIEREKKFLSSGPKSIVYSIMDTIVDRYFNLVQSLENEVDLLDDDLLDLKKNVDKTQMITSFHTLKGKIRSFKTMIVPLRDYVIKLSGGRVPEVFEGFENYFRDIHDHLQRLTTSLDSSNDMAQSGIHTAVALITIEDSKVTKKLAAWAAIFGVSTTMAGIWGMNFQNMPELSTKYGYYIALFAIFAVAGTVFIRLKKSGWL